MKHSMFQGHIIDPFTLKILLKILLTVCHTILMILVGGILVWDQLIIS